MQAWWGDGKGKTTAALGGGMRAASHGYRVPFLRFMKGGAGSVEDVRGESDAVAALPGFTSEAVGHRGWHGRLDATDDDPAARARAALPRPRPANAAEAADLTAPLPLDGAPTEGVPMLILDELLYAVDRGLIPERDVLDLARSKPGRLERVVTGSHTRLGYLLEAADLVTEVRKVKHPFDAGQTARKGTEY